MKYKKSDDPMNPNAVKRGEVDEVFLATAGEVMYRKHKAKTTTHLTESQRQIKLKKAEEIVNRANKKKGK